MDFYADESRVAALELRFGASEPLPLEALVELAWHLRQRDSRRALSLADEATQWLAAGDDDHAALRARLSLLRAEIAALNAEFERAADLLARARTAFEAIGDAAGVGDCYLGGALLAGLRDDERGQLVAAGLAATAYSLCDDPARSQLAAAWAALASTLAAPDSTTRRIDEARAPGAVPPGGTALLLALAEGRQALLAGEPVRAAMLFAGQTEAAEQFGMLHCRIRIGAWLGTAFAELGDREDALAWLEQALALARRAGWPQAIGDALAQLGDLVQQAGQPERALGLLNEALGWLAVVPASRGYARAQCYLGHVELQLGRNESALEQAEAAERIATALSAWPVVVDATTLAARALARLHAAEPARQHAARALALASQHGLPRWELEALRALADIHTAHPQPEHADAPLRCLERALDIAGLLGNPAEQTAVLERLSQAWEASGDAVQALRCERRARACAAGAEQQRQANRLAALEMRHRAEQQRLDAAHQRDLARLESVRAQELAGSLQVLENLGRIGREITASLDLSSVLFTLVAHLGKLVRVTYVGMSVLEADGKTLCRRGVEDGRPLPERRVSIDDPQSQAARCARERREILTDYPAGQRSQSHVPGTREMHASWFGPLLVGDELVGVLSIQSTDEHAYGERERLICRTLSAYVAVAVANARVYARLGDQHARLTEVEAEMRRLAATDALTGIPNRRQFLSVLALEIRRAWRTGRPLAVVMADIDHFKSVNDTLGHAAGDAVLTRVARVLDRGKRGVDTVGRLGGEEFAILLPETDLMQAAEVADRLRTAVAAEAFDWEGRGVPVTMSFGCAVLADPPAGGEEAAIAGLLQVADRALYQAKHAGRNCTAWLRDGEGALFSVVDEE
ncbi:GGDEF domain-containing protein [Chitinimonas koreensis]|uniref:GGDEF domain-containing protein n=1 Tax=Chitinimonas koreensis TaxID=356302 RepID=UPI0003FA3012|nr:GGDEF domain-containing protein [Chitinimonas koreensis]QNM97031.1 GGDEF domain-containing protein [Chitinimonas koreensis]